MSTNQAYKNYALKESIEYAITVLELALFVLDKENPVSGPDNIRPATNEHRENVIARNINEARKIINKVSTL